MPMHIGTTDLQSERFSTRAFVLLILMTLTTRYCHHYPFAFSKSSSKPPHSMPKRTFSHLHLLPKSVSKSASKIRRRLSICPWWMRWALWCNSILGSPWTLSHCLCLQRCAAVCHSPTRSPQCTPQRPHARRQSNRRIVSAYTMQHKSIHPVSPLRLLRLVNCRRCECCVRENYPSSVWCCALL
jgi:hypothetical protein